MKECEIDFAWEFIQNCYKKYLKHLGVKAIHLRDKNGNFTKDALVLVYLAKDYPNTKIVSKAELTEFVRKFYPNTIDV